MSQGEDNPQLRRGEIWWASLAAPAGSAPGYRRPVIVVSADQFNRSAIHTVTVVAITSQTEYADPPGNVLLRKKATKLPRDSVANVSQVATINKSILTERVSQLPPRLMHRIDEGLRLALSL